ncbi:hypothetical protein HDU87_008012 [Geranomyces variabilis]|uniref:Uncharacterized protein n=1 Tax=Geranomyces variabilis TaxID=109894 RepID=A0AAD5TP18_9FUNG|nr:hypothetical protein HDU87_008012 [Geranomyces variabilis]
MGGPGSTSLLCGTGSRQPSIASSRRQQPTHSHSRLNNLAASAASIPSTSPSIAPSGLRRQGSDLSVAYSLDESRYNTPLKEAMASWEDAFAAADGDSSVSIDERSVDDVSGHSAPSRGTGSRILSPSTRGSERSDLITRLPLHPVASHLLTSPRSLGYIPRVSGSGSARTVMNDATSSALNMSSSRIPTAGLSKPEKAVVDERAPTVIEESGSAASLLHAENTMHTLPIDRPSCPSEIPPAARSSSRRKRRWLLCAALTLSLIVCTAIVVGLVLLTLDRLGVLSWSTIKERIANAAKTVGNKFYYSFSPQVTKGGIVIIAIGSAAVALIGAGIGLAVRKHRRSSSQRRRSAVGPLVASSATLTDLPAPTGGKFSTFRSRGTPMQMQRSSSSGSLGLVHYNCDFILPSVPPLLPPDDQAQQRQHHSASAAEPPKAPYVAHRGGGGQVVRVLPSENAIRRIPTLVHGTLAPSMAGPTPPSLDPGRRKAS